MDSSFENSFTHASDDAASRGSINRFTSVILASLAIAWLAYIARKPKKGKMPPGPRGLPFIGNVFQLSDENWLTFTEWKFQYGTLYFPTRFDSSLMVCAL
jgi:hypothetical protein